MQKLLRISVLSCFVLSVRYANAVPSFARQTGLSCNVCHSNPPELTAFGRNFKLRGYVLTDMTKKEKVGNAKDLLLSKYIPVSVMLLLSNTANQSKQPATQNNSVGLPQMLSFYLAGGFASHFGGLAQLTYTHSDDHFGMDMVDLRYANQTKLRGKDFEYGINIDNSPTLEDVWNSTPAEGFPWIQTDSGVSPLASTVIDGVLAQDVAGVGGYALWNNHLYGDVSLYRSAHGGTPSPTTGVGQSYNISGVAPYWRVAWQQSWGANYLEVGTYGIYLNSFPNAISGPEDRYVDPSFDFQYERPFGPNLLDVHGAWMHEKSNLAATYLAGGAAFKDHHLNTLKIDSTYHWRDRYSATGALFSTTGNSDPKLYAPAPLTGSNNDNPDTSGYIGQVAFWPVQNIDINFNYTGYFKFNGAATNYDGAMRNASDNNTAYMSLWLIF